VPLRRQYGSRPLGALVPEMMAPLLQQRGFASATILTQWAEIVGLHIAKWTTPLEIRWPKLGKGVDHPNTAPGKAVLIIACPGAFALDVQNAEKAIIEAVNRRFGWACISAIRISQQPRPAPKPPVERKNLSPAEIAIISDGLGDIAQPDLRQALAELGAAIAKRQGG
jgi:hypothetical protein